MIPIQLSEVWRSDTSDEQHTNLADLDELLSRLDTIETETAGEAERIDELRGGYPVSRRNASFAYPKGWSGMFAAMVMPCAAAATARSNTEGNDSAGIAGRPTDPRFSCGIASVCGQ